MLAYVAMISDDTSFIEPSNHSEWTRALPCAIIFSFLCHFLRFFLISKFQNKLVWVFFFLFENTFSFFYNIYRIFKYFIFNLILEDTYFIFNLLVEDTYFMLLSWNFIIKYLLET